jgi:hypothetical protein
MPDEGAIWNAAKNCCLTTATRAECSFNAVYVRSARWHQGRLDVFSRSNGSRQKLELLFLVFKALAIFGFLGDYVLQRRYICINYPARRAASVKLCLLPSKKSLNFTWNSFERSHSISRRKVLRRRYTYS